MPVQGQKGIIALYTRRENSKFLETGYIEFENFLRIAVLTNESDEKFAGLCFPSGKEKRGLFL